MKCGPWLAIALTLTVSGYASAQTLGRGRAPANLYGYQPPLPGPPVEVAPPQPMPHVHAPPATRVRRTTPDLPVYTPSPGVDYVDGHYLGAFGHGPYSHHGGVLPRLHTPWGHGYCGRYAYAPCAPGGCGPHVPGPCGPAPCATKPPKKVRGRHARHTPHCCVAPAPAPCDKKARAHRTRKTKHGSPDNCYAGHRPWLPWAGWNGYGWWGGYPCGVPHPHGHDPLKPAVPPPVGHGPVVEPAPASTTEPQAGYRPPYSAERPTPAVVPSAAWNLEPVRKSF
jgi:hypothetical protein